jgi:hypothetical protein
VWVDKPGRYRITLRVPPEFEPLAPREVDLERGNTTTIEIQVQLER